MREERKGEIGRYKGQLGGYEERCTKEETVMTVWRKDECHRK